MSGEQPTADAQIAAAATLARSSVVGSALKWTLLVVIYPGLVGVITWAAAKLDTQADMAKLREAITGLTNQQQTSVARLDAAVPAIQQQLNGLQRDVVIATGSALAYESPKRAKDKLAAGEQLARSYDGRVLQMGSSAAAHDVIANVAVPSGSR